MIIGKLYRHARNAALRAELYVYLGDSNDQYLNLQCIDREFESRGKKNWISLFFHPASNGWLICNLTFDHSFSKNFILEVSSRHLYATL